MYNSHLFSLFTPFDLLTYGTFAIMIKRITRWYKPGGISE
jgi:hypothetical protein